MSEDLVLSRLLHALRGAETILDVGCGRGKYLSRLPRRFRASALDAHAPSLEGVEGAERKIHGRAQDILPSLPDASQDVVFALDVVEHLEKEESRRAIQEMIRIARLRVVVFTPEGFREQGPAGFASPEEGFWQTHRCGWTTEELEQMGFTVERWEGFDDGRGRADVLWAVREVGGVPCISDCVVRRLPAHCQQVGACDRSDEPGPKAEP